MNRRERSQVLAAASAEEVGHLAGIIQAGHEVRILKEPQTTPKGPA